MDVTGSLVGPRCLYTFDRITSLRFTFRYVVVSCSDRNNLYRWSCHLPRHHLCRRRLRTQVRFTSKFVCGHF